MCLQEGVCWSGGLQVDVCREVVFGKVSSGSCLQRSCLLKWSSSAGLSVRVMVFMKVSPERLSVVCWSGGGLLE